MNDCVAKHEIRSTPRSRQRPVERASARCHVSGEVSAAWRPLYSLDRPNQTAPNPLSQRAARAQPRAPCSLQTQPRKTGGRPKRHMPPFRGRLARSASGVWKCAAGPKVCAANFGIFLGTARKNATEPADKPGFVVDSHSSRRIVTDTLKQPTRRHRGSRHRLPIWSCSRWGLPCRSVAGLAVRSYRTISPLPRALPPLCRLRNHLAGFAGKCAASI